MTAARASVVPATLAAIAAGIGIAVQTSINGHANVEVGSPVLATAINHGSALTLSLIVALAMGAFPRAVRSLRANRAQVRWWWFLGGIMGLAGVMSIIAVTPQLGVVVVAVAVTLGQLAGSIIADSGGLGPAGKRPLTMLRIAGVGVAIVAVGAGAFGRFEPENLWVIPVVIVAGVIIAIQQAFNGWLVVVTGEFSIMSVINFTVSFFFVAIAVVVATLIQPLDFTAIPLWSPLGGFIGAIVGVISALTLRIVGVLTAVLCIAAGQAIGGIVMDLLLPVDAVGLTVGSIIGAVLAVVAVGLAGLGGITAGRRDRRAADAAAADADAAALHARTIEALGADDETIDEAAAMRPGESP